MRVAPAIPASWLVPMAPVDVQERLVEMNNEVARLIEESKTKGATFVAKDDANEEWKPKAGLSSRDAAFAEHLAAALKEASDTGIDSRSAITQRMMRGLDDNEKRSTRR